ncbi:MAG: TolC family protein [Bacteroidaceae bacterium]|nr:TolC family protein [Bacteroidaceae bacterium]
MKKKLILISAFLSVTVAFSNTGNILAQNDGSSGESVIGPRILSMEAVIRLAQENSISAMTNRNIFAASYWQYRSYTAQYRPSLNLNGNVGNFNRSLQPLQDYQTGAIAYRSNYNMRNDLTLSIRQNVALTGGTFSLSTSLSRLDQYAPNRLTTWYAQPIYLTYMQNLWGYNSLKWDRKIEPHNYEIAKRQYLENMENVTISAADCFWNLNSAKVSYQTAVQSFEDSKRLYEAAQTRFRMGTITRDNLLQIELRMLNDSLAIRSQEVILKSAQNQLCSYIGYQEGTDITLSISYSIPDILLNFDDVLEKALDNSSFSLSQTVSRVEADRSIASARANQGITASVNATFGMSNNADSFSDTFVALQDQEVVGVTFALPIVDWGLGKGRVQMAKAQAETTKSQLDQSLMDYRQDIMVRVMQFNNQRGQCEISKRAMQIAEESYELALRNFGSGTMSVTELNQLQDTRDDARNSYENNVRSFWNQYFSLRKTTLYDFISGTDINAEFDRIVK